MKLAQSSLSIVAVILLIGLIGCGKGAEKKRQEQARAALLVEERANLVKVTTEQLAPTVETYVTTLEGVSKLAEKIITNLDDYRQNELKEIEAKNPSQAARLTGMAVAKYYAQFQTSIRVVLEMLEDRDVEKSLTRLTNSVGLLMETRQVTDNDDATTLSAGIELCEKAHEQLRKYRQRIRTDEISQLRQMKDCSGELKKTLEPLKEIQDKLKNK